MAQNTDLKARFEDWLLNPVETLDWEVKTWLQMDDIESQGIVAKELIALENHGGGFLVIGFAENSDKQLVPSLNAPDSLKSYMTDAINAIIKKRAEPAFHVEVSVLEHPATGIKHPVVRVPGTSKVPVRSDSETPKKSLSNYTHYIRAPGPESRAPLSAAEWDALIRRSILNQREELIGVLRNYLPPFLEAGSHPVNSASNIDKLEEFVTTAISRWDEKNSSLPITSPSRIKNGFYAMSARVVGIPRKLSAAEILRANGDARRYTGWPPFVEINRDALIRPHPYGSGIEAWLGADGQTDVGHADYWQIVQPNGMFLLVRGYQEDSNSFDGTGLQPGTRFEATLPVWRVGEFVLRIAELTQVLFEVGSEIEFQCRWTGLSGRRLFVHRGHRWISDKVASDDKITSSTVVPAANAAELLPDVVENLTKPLYQNFEFHSPSKAFYSEELASMSSRKY